QKLSQLAAILGDRQVASFEERLQQIGTERSEAQRRLLEDSLEIDLAQAVSRARDRAALSRRIALIAAELQATSAERHLELLSALAFADQVPQDEAEQLEQEAEAILKELRDDAAAHARRQAVLKGLGSLGYEVTEGLETAWVRDGRLVLRKP